MNGRIFALKEHIERWYESAEKIQIRMPYKITELAGWIVRTVQAVGLSDDEKGYLRITDRLKSLIVLSNGKKVAPQEVENTLRLDPLILQVVPWGDQKSYLTALVIPDMKVLSGRLGCVVPGNEKEALELCGEDRSEKEETIYTRSRHSSRSSALLLEIPTITVATGHFTAWCGT